MNNYRKNIGKGNQIYKGVKETYNPRRTRTKTNNKIRIKETDLLSFSLSLPLVPMETQLSNADTDSLQQLLNLSLGAKDSTTKIVVNGSRSANSTNNPQYQPLDIEFVEKILNYKFKDKSLLLQAFTDATFDENCVSYERLEFLGDTVLNMVITKYLYNRYGDCSPGLLTNLRAVNVDTEKLARVAVKHNLHRCLRHKKPLLEDQVSFFLKTL